MIDATRIIEYYTLSQHDKEKLRDALKLAYLMALHAAYVRSAKNAGTSSARQASIEEEAQAGEIAEQDVTSIAETYADDLQRAIDVFLSAWFSAHGSHDGVKPHLAAMLTAWCKARAEWKSEQVARGIVGRGLSAGIATFVNDYLSGKIVDTSGMGTDGLYVAVVPATSSTDECKAYAGYMWPIEKYPGLGTFPSHVGCIHFEIILRH